MKTDFHNKYFALSLALKEEEVNSEISLFLWRAQSEAVSLECDLRINVDNLLAFYIVWWIGSRIWVKIVWIGNNTITTLKEGPSVEMARDRNIEAWLLVSLSQNIGT